MKKIFVLLLVLSLIFCGGCSKKEETPVLEETASKPSVEIPVVSYHTAAQEFAGGSGTAEDPYQIADVSQLVLLGEKMEEEAETYDYDYTNACYVLTADLDLNDVSGDADYQRQVPEYGWRPLGQGSIFGGEFDGAGHVIRGMYIFADADAETEYNNRSYGLFSRVNGTVRNVKMEHTYIYIVGTGSAAGSVAGDLVLEGAVENCQSDAVICVGGGMSAGGIVGENGSVSNCAFSGVITQHDNTFAQLGGITGYGTAVSNCQNSGSITSTGSSYAGGIAGWSGQIKDCINVGTVYGDVAGGIVGNVFAAGTNLELEVTEYIIENCKNEGSITASTMAAGIVGHFANDEEDIDMVVRGCENHGAVSANMCAGIVGTLACERADDMTVEFCVNYADIVGDTKAGGIVCELLGGLSEQNGDVTIRGCENRGAITAGDYASGVVTYFMLMASEIDLTVDVEACKNHGAITAGKYAGGIMGFSTGGVMDAKLSDGCGITFDHCENTAPITATSSNSFAGGIAGNFYSKGIEALFTGCKNSGNVCVEFSLSQDVIDETVSQGAVMTLSQMAGGIVGRIGDGLFLDTGSEAQDEKYINAQNALIVFTGCSNTGSITATDYSSYVDENGTSIWQNYIGDIVGYAAGEKDCSYRID